MSLCKRKVNSHLEDDAGRPVQPMTVLRARPVSVEDAAKLPGADVELGIGEQTDGYLASCKVKFVDADLATMPWPEENAVLVSERGDVTFVVDRF